MIKVPGRPSSLAVIPDASMAQIGQIFIWFCTKVRRGAYLSTWCLVCRSIFQKGCTHEVRPQVYCLWF